MKYGKAKQGGGYDIRIINDTSPAGAAQADIYESLGYTRVTEAQKPDESRYIVWSAGYRPATGGGIEEFYWSAPRIIPLSRDKLIAVVAAHGWLEQAIAVFENNPAAKDWWANSMNYVEGSPMAVAFQEAFGLTLDKVHEIVEASRRV